MSSSATPDEKNLAGLERQADAVLSQIEVKNDSAADCVTQKPEDSEWFRGDSTRWQSPRDFEWTHHPFVMRLLVLMTLVWFAGLYINIAFRPPPPLDPYHVVEGTVVACGVIGVSSLRGGNRVIATVRAPDGQLVMIPVISGTPLEKGTKVPLREYSNRRYVLDHPL
ncbi:MAG: hypothetical protein ACREPP_05340 [Rhodanobacteraceae bacterium]